MKAYLKMCMLLIYLSALSGYLAAQVTGTAVNELADSTKNTTGRPSGAVIIEQLDDSVEPPLQTRSCVNTFTNQTVSTFLLIEGCSTLVVQGVTVASGGDLYLLAPGEITINGAFDVALGGQLHVNMTQLPPPPPPPAGNTLLTAINIGTFGSPFQYANSQNTSVGFTNDYVGQPTNDVFYVFTLTAAMTITIKHCNSQIATYLHLLDASGTGIASNGGYSGAGACANSSHAYLKQYLAPGIYYIVSEGYSANGNIQTAVEGALPQSIFEYDYDASGNRISRTFVP